MGRSRGLWLAESESPDVRAAADAFEAMLAGWRDQQLSRCLNEKTIDDPRTPGAPVPPPQHGVAVAVVARTPRVVGGRTAQRRRTGSFDDPQLPARRRRVLRLRLRPRLWLGDVVHDPVRLGTGADLSGREPGQARHRLRRTPRSALVDADRAPGALRRGRRRRGVHPGRSQEGLGAGLSRRHHAQGHLWLGAPTTRGPHARAKRLQLQPQGTRVRRLRRVSGALRQGGQGRPATPARGAHRVRLVDRGARRMDRRRLADDGERRRRACGPPNVGRSSARTASTPPSPVRPERRACHRGSPCTACATAM